MVERKKNHGLRARALDVAKLAGVSRSAVSRAFSETAYIAPETKAKVLKAAAKLNYSPDTLASGLARGRTNIVVVVLNRIHSVRDGGMHSVVLHALQAAGRVPVVLTVEPDDDGGEILQEFIRFPIEAMVIMADSITPDNAVAAAPYLRPIMLNEHYAHPGVDAIVIDDAQGISRIVNALWDTGHRRVAYMEGRTSAARARRRALIQELTQKGMELTAEALGNFDYHQSFEATPLLLENKERPEAIICASDFMAMGVMDYLRLHTSLCVPRDISITGFDGVALASWPIYNLATVRPDIDTVVARLMKLILHSPERIGEDTSLQPSVKMHLIPGGSITQR